MKLLTRLPAYLFGIGLSLLLFTCKKEDTDNSMGNSSTTINHPPIANAGIDFALNRVYCSSQNSVELNGSSSSDPDHYKLLYEWTKISGPSCNLSDAYSAVVYVNNLQTGQYAFELKVTDKGGLSSTDTVAINVTGSPSPIEINLDFNFNAGYGFSIGKGVTGMQEAIYAALCHAYGQCPLLDYKARITLTKTFEQPSVGSFSFKMNEIADTNAVSNYHETSIVLTNPYIPEWWASGQCSINFKQLIQAGGGLFNGTFQINDGSALGCDQNIYTNLAPLIVSGTLDTTAHTVSLSLKGRAYF
jgi:hypothetical protein